MALFGSRQWGVPLWGSGITSLVAGGGNAGGLGRKFPSEIPGLTFTELKTPEFRTLVQSSPDKYEVRLPQTRNPVWHFELTYDYLYGAFHSPNNQLAFAPYTDIASFMGFFNANYGQYGEFLYNDPKDNSASGVLYGTWQPNHAYSLNDLIIDPTGDAQLVTMAGTSGATMPPWYIADPDVPSLLDSGGATPDGAGALVWTNQGYYPDGYPGVPVTLPLVFDATGNAYSPIQRNCAGLFSEDVTDLNGDIVVWANGLLQPVTAYVIAGLGLGVPGTSCRGLYLAWLSPPTPPITAAFQFYFRVRMESDQQDFERFMDELWTIGGGSSKNGSGSLKLMSARSVGAITPVPGSGGSFGGGTPVISVFTASPDAIASGDSSTLAWVVSGADSLSISAGVGVVTGSSVSVSPTTGTTYRLTASNASGDTTADITISVSGGTGGPTINSFFASPSGISPGQTTTLSWDVSGSTGVSIDHGVGSVAASGSVNVNPSVTTDYLLTATNGTGSNTADAFVSVGGSGTLREVGSEMGMQFGRLLGTLSQNQAVICQWGDYIGGLDSPYVPWCPANLKTQGIDIFLSTWGAGSNAAHSSNWIPSSIRDTYGVRRGGALVTKVVAGQTLYLMNMASTGYQNYLWQTFFPNYLAHNGPLFHHGVTPSASNTTMATLDAWYSDYDTGWGATPFDAPAPQTRSAWYAGIDAFFASANAQCPQIRLTPHLGSMEDPSLATFKSIFSKCPYLLKEPFEIGSLGNRSQLVSQILNLYWFANQAPKVLANDPQNGRIVLFGCWADNHDYHSALGLYCLQRGPNTFFDLLVTSPSQTPVAQSLCFTPALRKLGPATSGPVLISGSGASSFFKRSFGASAFGSGGTAYFNFDTSAHTVTPPGGSKDWNGNPVGTSLTVRAGTGDVVLN